MADPGGSFKSGAQIFIPATLKNYFKYKYLLQVSMKKCGESVVERRFLRLGKIWIKSRSAHEFSYGFLPASAKFTFDVIDGTKCK